MNKTAGYCPLYGWTEKCPRVKYLQAKIKQLQAKNKQLEEALKANIKYCEYYDGKKICGKIARWGVFDYDGWAEYYCDKHKKGKLNRNKPEPEELKSNILAEEALKALKNL